jgi:hypothetical protein
MAQASKVEHHIHKLDGTISERNSYRTTQCARRAKEKKPDVARRTSPPAQRRGVVPRVIDVAEEPARSPVLADGRFPNIQPPE